MSIGIERRRYMGSEDNPLPSGYTQLDYLTSDGTAYIDTGYTPNTYTDWRMTARFDVVPTASAGHGLSWVNYTTILRMHVCYFATLTAGPQYATISAWRAAQSGYDSTECAYILPDTEWHDYVLAPSEVAIDDTSVTPTSSTILPSNSYNLYLFARNAGGTITNKGQMSIKRCTISENGTTLLDLIPCINSSNTYGFYDIINDTFITSPVGGLSGGGV